MIPILRHDRRSQISCYRTLINTFIYFCCSCL